MAVTSAKIDFSTFSIMFTFLFICHAYNSNTYFVDLIPSLVRVIISL